MRNKDKVKIIVAVIGLIGIVVNAISHAGNDRNSGSIRVSTMPQMILITRTMPIIPII